MKGYRDLPVWQRSVDLAVEVFRLAKQLPWEERFGITSQLKRASVSVSSNIAEGSGRHTTPDLRKFLSYSRGSVKETESLLIVCNRVELLSTKDI